MSRNQQQSILKFLKRFMLAPVLAEKSVLFSVAIALAFLSLTQATVLLLIKGFLAAFFTDVNVQEISLASLIPGKFSQSLGALESLQFKRADLVIFVPTTIALAGAVKAFSTYIYNKGIVGLSLKVAQNYREKVFESIVLLPWLSIIKRNSGEWMSVIMADAIFIQSRLGDFSTAFIKDGVLIVTCIATLSFIHWPAALILLLLTPIIGWQMGRTGKRIAWFTEAFQRELGALAGRVLSVRERFRFMRAQHGEDFEIKQFARGNDAYLKMMSGSILVRALVAPGMEFVGFAIFALFIYGWTRSLPGFAMSPEIVVQFFVAMGLILKPIREMGEQVARWSETVGGLRRSMEVIYEVDRHFANALQENIKQNISVNSTGIISNEKLQLDIEGIEIAYDNIVKLKADFLQIYSGRAIAIIGPSGAGKSTLLKALAGLVKPKVWQGNYSIDQIVSITSLVSQSPFLFKDTLKNNLLYGLPDVIRHGTTDEMLWGALNVVNLSSVIKALPSGLESMFNPLDTNLSGGQIQRLVIARAILRRPKILLLDEATSAVDGATEEDMTRRLIDTVHETGTVLLAVTHRLRWLEIYDEIWFVENGKISLKGKHQGLLASERYRQFTSNVSEGES